VSVQPIGPDQIEVHVRCRHDGCLTGFQLGEVVTERAAVCSAIMHFHLSSGCGCMRALWSRFRTAAAPADLDGVRDRFDHVWADVADQQTRQGYAVLDWAAAVQRVAGKVTP